MKEYRGWGNDIFEISVVIDTLLQHHYTISPCQTPWFRTLSATDQKHRQSKGLPVTPAKLSYFWERLANLARRVAWMTSLSGNPLTALRLVLGIRKDIFAPQVIPVASGKIVFRGVDEQALKEVLIDLEYAFLEDALRDVTSPHVLDVGAHIGTFAIWLLGVNPRARIVSVEADPETYKLIERNAMSSRDLGLSWNTIHAAASMRDGDIVFLSDSGPSMSHRIEANGTVAVQTTSLTTLLDQTASQGRKIDLMKVDIEGSEEDFLCAMPEILAHVQALVIELHPSLCNTERVCSHLVRYFDEIIEVGGRTSSKPLLYCRRSSNWSAV